MTTALFSICFAVPANADVRYEVKADEKVDIPAGVYENNINQAAPGYGSLADVEGGTLKIAGDSQIKGNKANYGGAIYNKGGTIEIGKTIFENNEAKTGGAIYTYKTGSTAIIAEESVFRNNTATHTGGGALYVGSTGKLAVGNNTVFDKNIVAEKGSLQYGGAIYNNTGELNIGSNVVFKNNKLLGKYASGGAIVSSNGNLKIGDGALFEGNESNYGGGAIYITGKAHTDVTINKATFRNNKDNSDGGAVALNVNDPAKTITITNSMFDHNAAANNGGAFVQFQTKGNGAKIEIDNTTFLNNEAGYEGGALTSDSIMNITNSTFTGNKTLNEEDTPLRAGGGAIALWDQGKVTIKDSVFNNNTTASKGGVIGTRSKETASETSFIYIEDSKFDGNNAGLDGGAISTFVPTTIINSSFTNNTSGGKGGALTVGNDATLTIQGDNNFTGNSDSTGDNDISNEKGRIEVSGNLTLDGGISGAGTTVFEEGSVLTITTGKTKITNDVINNGASVNLIINTGFEGEYQLVEGTLDKEFYDYDKNKIYKVDSIQNGSYNVSKKSAEEVSEALDVATSTATAVLAAVSGSDTDNAEFNAIADKLNEAAQTGNTAVVREAEKLGADASPVVRVVETMRSNMIFAAVNDELNEADGAMAESMSSGDYFRKVKVWIRSLYNYADKDGTSKAAGFDADTYGVAMGIDKELNNHVKAGLGYAYSQTDVNGRGRDTDVDSNTLFVYGQYKPANWYLNTALAYSWSEYDEKKSVLGYNADAKYDVDTIALQSMYGFEGKFGDYDLNPEIGLRYMRIAEDGYTDKLGSKVKSKDSDVLTLVAGAKIAKDFELENDRVLRPELRAAVTYDVISDDNNANVILANGAGYRVNSEKLKRLGVELGANVATEVANNWELSAGYEIRLREDYYDNTFMLNAKYSF